MHAQTVTHWLQTPRIMAIQDPGERCGLVTFFGLPGGYGEYLGPVQSRAWAKSFCFCGLRVAVQRVVV